VPGRPPAEIEFGAGKIDNCRATKFDTSQFSLLEIDNSSFYFVIGSQRVSAGRLQIRLMITSLKG